jgi:DNA modification methylase
MQEFIEDLSVDHVFTSPPYLNNFDYADRTRLELYFWGEAKSWGEISEKIRTQLMTSATTQINRSNTRYEILSDFRKDCPSVTSFIEESVDKLMTIRKTKGGKKSYDLMVAGYFNDMYQIVRDIFRVLKPASKALFVLGDSAPYGIHIPTDKLIGEIGISLGFASYEIEILRTRGDKWKANPQRHTIPLRESIVILSK